MRELRVIRPVRPRRPEPPREARRYGPTYEDLSLWVAHKFAVDAHDARAIVREIFQFIRAEVLLHGAQFSIHNFGTFHRLVTNYNRNAAVFGTGSPERTYMRFRQPAHHASDQTIRDEHEELVEPTAEEIELFYPEEASDDAG